MNTMNNYEVKSKEWFLRNTSNLIQKPFPNEAASHYYVEILSVCDLKCCMCGFGSKEIFQRKNQLMDIDMFTKIIKKIQKESPHATVSPFCQCEPSLHPQFTEMVKIIKDHNFNCVVSLNFNTTTKIKELVGKIIAGWGQQVELLLIILLFANFETRNKTHVFSMSDSYDLSNMWGYYADSGKGFCGCDCFLI